MGVIWEQCAGKSWCVHIPFDGEKCLNASACVRLIEANAKFYLEIEISGNKQRIDLGDSCVEARWYVFAAKVCAANVVIKPKSVEFDVILRLCIDANLGPIHVGECVDVLSQHVQIATFTSAQLAELGFADASIPDGARRGAGETWAYVETQIANAAAEGLVKQLDKMN